MLFLNGYLMPVFSISGFLDFVTLVNRIQLDLPAKSCFYTLLEFLSLTKEILGAIVVAGVVGWSYVFGL